MVRPPSVVKIICVSCGLQEAERGPARSDGRCRVCPDGMREQFVVRIAKVNGVLQISVIEVGEAGLVTVESALDGNACDEDRAGCPVIGALPRRWRASCARIRNTPSR